ncbi:uncharacterized protein BDZ99DRAFT_5352 [Mytilinidion resinicola]|uniref:Uncharacterized protein n=1 Tax=Mytilinidion resinicola TaxID=574789 RepID=A0A6A6Z9J7_9PEZI|nr:uncharacterized protein BDZ99DRAFT_5352 [Mytilinidion resinicola]KAF2816954.1 hypothetical protein BDZ99DRAFT_5352 [Mytilinidion resinicola]
MIATLRAARRAMPHLAPVRGLPDAVRLPYRSTSHVLAAPAEGSVIPAARSCRRSMECSLFAAASIGSLVMQAGTIPTLVSRQTRQRGINIIVHYQITSALAMSCHAATSRVKIPLVLSSSFATLPISEGYTSSATSECSGNCLIWSLVAYCPRLLTFTPA